MKTRFFINLFLLIVIFVSIGIAVYFESRRWGGEVPEIVLGKVYVCQHCADNAEVCLLEEVRHFIHLYNVRFPEVVFAKFLLETGHGTSRLFLEDNNPFGMKQPRQRLTTSLGAGVSGFATFTSIEAAVIDYLIWQRRWTHIYCQDEFIRLMGVYYAEDPNYTNLLRRLL